MNDKGVLIITLVTVLSDFISRRLQTNVFCHYHPQCVQKYSQHKIWYEGLALANAMESEYTIIGDWFEEYFFFKFY